jgi:hypothetical protein
MAEVQSHGFNFEKWVRDHFFGGYVGSYMQKWDVDPAHNVYDEVPPEFRHLPVSIKTAKTGTPIGLGDVLRQRQIDHDFLMITGFWQQRTRTEKWIVDIGYAVFSTDLWNQLWGQLSLAELRNIDAIVKDMAEHYSSVRERAKQWKVQISVHNSTIVINPKIDSKTQRRIQCSLPVATFWQLASRDALVVPCASLWNKPFPNPIISAPRVFY